VSPHSNARPGDRPDGRRLRAVLALLAVTVIWGWTFVWMKQGLLAAERMWAGRGAVAAIGLFMLLRFGLAAVLLPLAVPSARRGLTAEVHMGGFLLGVLLLAGFLLQMFGLRHVSPAVSAFLTSLYVVFTAVLTTVTTRRGVGLPLVLGCLLATFGGGWISGPPQVSFGLAEWLTVACAFVFAVHILAIDRITRRLATMPVTFTSFVWIALGGLVTLLAGLAGKDAPGWSDLVALALDPGFAVPMLLSSVVATVVAISLMNTFQRDLDPVRAAILYAVEPVWAALVALWIGLGTADRWLWIGGAALLTGNLIAELVSSARARAVPGGGA
jgi:drug/metabolite transporter (DMT)-like permease